MLSHFSRPGRDRGGDHGSDRCVLPEMARLMDDCARSHSDRAACRFADSAYTMCVVLGRPCVVPWIRAYLFRSIAPGSLDGFVNRRPAHRLFGQQAISRTPRPHGRGRGPAVGRPSEPRAHLVRESRRYGFLWLVRCGRPFVVLRRGRRQCAVLLHRAIAICSARRYTTLAALTALSCS